MKTRQSNTHLSGVMIAVAMLLMGCSNITILGINAPRTPVPVATISDANPAHNARASRNWSGYEIVKNSVTAITGTWQVPQVSGPTESDSSTWVGIGGDRSQKLIQAGTDQVIQHGQPFYYAWVEQLPDPPVQIKEISLLPGDTVTFTLTQGQGAAWTLVVTDKDSRQTVTKQLTYLSCNCSAEWVEEAPSVDNRETILANFGSVTFTEVAATISQKSVNLISGGSRPIRMTDAAGHVLAEPQVAQANGFSVVYIPPIAASRLIP